jgi:CheY-like chemotaxis protein
MFDPSTKVVMVVEDEAATRSLLTMILESQDYHVVMAGDGQDALDKVREHRPDAILLDLMLPGIDGYEVIRILNDGSMPVPIIALSAAGASTEIVGGNVRASLQKPCGTDVILRTLERVLMETAAAC